MSRDDIKETLKSLEEGVKDIYDSDRYKNFLDVMSRFHTYSLNNQMLIQMQRPEATYVAGYKDWQKKFKRQVNQGERGIKILAPYTYNIDVPTDKSDEFGNVIYVKKKMINFKIAYVYDVSQTSGTELPSLANPLEASVSGYDTLFSAIKEISDYDIEFANTAPAKGYCVPAERVIRINEGMSQAQTIKTAIHEVAHERLHSEGDIDKRQAEVEAESIAYVVCSRLGIDTSDYSFEYIAAWAQSKESNYLKDSLSRIRAEAVEMIGLMEGHLDKSTYKVDEDNLSVAAGEILAESNLNATVTNVYVYSGNEHRYISMNVISEVYGYNAVFNISNMSKERLGELLVPGTQYDYLDNYLISNGAVIEVVPTRDEAEYDMRYTLDTGSLEILKDSNIKHISAVLEYSGDVKEDAVFSALNSRMVMSDGVVADLNPLGSDLGIEEPYTERLSKYEDLEYDSSWPMVAIVYSNVDNIPTNYININEAVELVNRIDDDTVINPTAYLKVKISYVYNDWKYEHVQNLDISKGRMNFIDYLKLPPNIISHLKSHNSIMEKCNQALNFAPDTSYGNEYSDKVLEWAEYCRMELNHNSDNPLIPLPPQINDSYNIQGKEEWRLDR